MKHPLKAKKKPTESLCKAPPTQEISQTKSAMNFTEKPPRIIAPPNTENKTEKEKRNRVG